MAVSIVMVCLGNICRSPLAQGILESKVDTSIFVDSAGTGNYHIGKKPDTRSIAVAAKHNIDISRQKCRQFTKADFSKFDVIYVMDDANKTNVLALATTAAERNKVKLLLSETHHEPKEVPDPYYGGDDGFDYIYSLIDAACTNIANKINQSATK